MDGGASVGAVGALGFIGYDEMQNIRGGYSGLWKHVLHIFFGPTWNFTIGFRVLDGFRNKFLIKSVLRCFLQDEKAHKELKASKGAGGLSCCHTCKNIFNGDPDRVRGNRYIHHYAFATPPQFDPHDDASMWEAADTLSAQKLVLSTAEFNKEEMTYGQNYDPDSLLWDIGLRRYFKPHSSCFWDWMHIVAASGGTAQYSIACFCRELHNSRDAHGVSLQQLDEFQCVAHDGVQNHTLLKNFFQKRVSLKEGTHLKAFASECLTALSVLAVFCRMVLKPKRILSDQCDMILILNDICDILTSGDLAVAQADVLARKIGQHHQAMLRLYGHDCLKIKTHLVYHVPECFVRFNINASCFSNERRNRLVKATCIHIPGSHLSKSLLGRILIDLEDRLSRARLQENCLLCPIYDAMELASAVPGPRRPIRVRVSKSIAFKRGPVRQGMIVSASAADGGVFFFQFVSGIEITFTSLDQPSIYALGELLDRVGPDVLQLSGRYAKISPSSFIRQHMHCKDGNSVRLTIVPD